MHICGMWRYLQLFVNHGSVVWKKHVDYIWHWHLCVTILSLKVTQSIILNSYLPAIQTTSLHFWHKNLPHTLSQKQKALDNELFLSRVRHSGTHYSMVFVTQHQQLLSGRGAISRCTFSCLQYMYLYYVCALRSDFGHVWLLTTLVYILKLLYVNKYFIFVDSGVIQI